MIHEIFRKFGLQGDLDRFLENSSIFLEVPVRIQNIFLENSSKLKMFNFATVYEGPLFFVELTILTKINIAHDFFPKFWFQGESDRFWKTRPIFYRKVG